MLRKHYSVQTRVWAKSCWCICVCCSTCMCVRGPRSASSWLDEVGPLSQMRCWELRVISEDLSETVSDHRLGQSMVKFGSGQGPKGTAILSHQVCFSKCFEGKQADPCFWVQCNVSCLCHSYRCSWIEAFLEPHKLILIPTWTIWTFEKASVQEHLNISKSFLGFTTETGQIVFPQGFPYFINPS